MAQTPTQPQRICVRLPCEFPAEITFSGGETEIIKKATVSNISTTGIQILSPSFIATGQMVQASFKIPGQSSKTIFNAEVMRIESLQGRMIGHYPYALGAKFVTPETKQEKQITRFISNKVTCASLRVGAAWLFFALGIIQIGRALLHTFFASSEISALDLRGFSSLATGSWILHPLLLGAIALGFLSSTLLCILNKKKFMEWGFSWAIVQILLSAFIVFAKRGLLSRDLTDVLLWSSEWLLLGLAIGLIAITHQIRAKFKTMEKILSPDRASSGPKRPTFTIL